VAPSGGIGTEACRIIRAKIKCHKIKFVNDFFHLIGRGEDSPLEAGFIQYRGVQGKKELAGAAMG
jgi:hypothetical protein